LLHREGHEVWVRLKRSLVRDEGGAPSFVVLQFQDISEEREREADLRYLADHDVMTDTFNRRRFEEELNRAAAEARRGLGSAALLVVDLDQFKYINDTYGHSAGDQVLRSVAAALKARLRASDMLGRLGGDEFGILCPRTDVVAARLLAESLLRTVREDASILVGERTVRAAASIGVTVIDGQDVSSEQLLAAADLAMYEAKEAGRERVSVNVGGAGLSSIRSRLAWSERIREALDDDGFRLWEQPILNLATGACDRSELLIRMIDPLDGTVIAPGQFLDAAERLGQIQSIDRWVFREAVALLALRRAGGDTRAVEINLSGTSLTDEALIDELIDFISAAPIDPTLLMVEITETAAVRNFDLARTFARRLADQGCRFLLDDFGAGFGSFTYLKHLPFDGIKIDGEFVKDLPHSRTDQLTVTAVVSLAKGLGKEVVAEFVQDDATIAMLKELGVDYAQGYHIGKPNEVPELARPHLRSTLATGSSRQL